MSINVANLYMKKSGGAPHEDTDRCIPPPASSGFIEGGLDAIYGGACTLGQFIDDQPLIAAFLVVIILYALWIIAGSPPLKFPGTIASKFDSWGMNSNDDNPTYIADSWTNVPYKWRA
jgi:hypothetical protein